jgi:hypothetical protein
MKLFLRYFKPVFRIELGECRSDTRFYLIVDPDPDPGIAITRKQKFLHFLFLCFQISIFYVLKFAFWK